MDFARFDKRHYRTLPVRDGYGEWSATYEADVARELDMDLLDHVPVRWAEVDRALDLACGTGRIGEWLRAHGVQALDGVDMTPAMLDQARAKGIYDRLVEGDVRATGLPDATYNLVTMVLADEHLPDLRPLYGEVARLLAAGGRFVLIGYHPHFMLNGIPTHYDRPSGESIAIQLHVHLLSDHVRAAFAAGMTLVDMEEAIVDDGWIAAKPSWARYTGHPVSFSTTFCSPLPSGEG